MSPMEDLTLLQLEGGLFSPSAPSPGMGSVYHGADKNSRSSMETSDIIVQGVYQGAEDVVGAERLLATPMVQPLNFGLVVPGVYRSSYPQTHDYDYLRELELKTIVTLVQKDMPEGFQSFIDGSGIKHHVFNMIGTKKEEVPLDMMRSIIELVLDERNHPLLIHCNHGKHRTGCVVGVLRKLNGWDISSILAEYTKYAEPKVREADVRYLSDFQLANLRQIVTLKLEDQPMSIGQFLLLTVVAAFSLCIWVLSLKLGPCFSRPPPREEEP